MHRLALSTMIPLVVLTAGGGCALWRSGVAPPNMYEVTRGQLVVRSDFPLATHHRLIEELLARQADLCRHLELPVSDEPIEIYLFENGKSFQQFMSERYPSLPPRRAFFMETDTRLRVYAQWGDHISEDLRHEATHGFLHAVVPGLPLWLDEGLAEYYEVPRSNPGVNAQHLALLGPRLREGAWHPNLCRLEQLRPTADMDQNDYAEAWSWVHFLLHTRPESRDLLRRYLRDLRREGQAEPISLRLRQKWGDVTPALIDHIRQLSMSMQAPAAVQAPAVAER